MEKRLVCEIARDIRKEWKNVNYAAKPYLDAMRDLSTVNDKFGFDDGRSIVLYFLNNAGSFRGDAARRLKAELKDLLK